MIVFVTALCSLSMITAAAIIGFGGRIIDQGEPKYLNSPETPLISKRS